MVQPETLLIIFQEIGCRAFALQTLAPSKLYARSIPCVLIEQAYPSLQSLSPLGPILITRLQFLSCYLDRTSLLLPERLSAQKMPLRLFLGSLLANLIHPLLPFLLLILFPVPIPAFFNRRIPLITLIIYPLLYL